MPKFTSQQRLDGITIEEHQVRFSGTIVIPESDLDHISLDALTVFVIAARADKVDAVMAGAERIGRLKYVENVQFAIPLTGVLREDALKYLRDLHGEIHFPESERTMTDPAQHEPYAAPVPAPEPNPVPPANIDADGVVEAPAEVTMAQADPVEVVSQGGQHSVVGEGPAATAAEDYQAAAPESDRESLVIERAGPPPDDSPPKPGAFKNATFDPDEAPGEPLPPDTTIVAATREVVGSVHRDDRKGDPALDQFLNETV